LFFEGIDDHIESLELEEESPMPCWRRVADNVIDAIIDATMTDGMATTTRSLLPMRRSTGGDEKQT